jgi:hypothetical protein
MRPFETLRGRRIGLLVIVLTGLCVFYPAVRSPLFLDDYLHTAMVEDTFAAKRSPFDLYDFVDDADRAGLRERGLLPWWAHPQLTIRFFRPLSSALLWAEHRVFSHGALPMHLLSLAWWLAAVFAVRALFRRFFSERVALIGTAIFALSPCHALPLAWVANSETLVALVFGALALARLLRFRTSDTGAVKDAWLSGVFFALALLSGGEYALGFGGYVLGIELAVWRARRPARDRVLDHLRGIVPFALPAGLYLVVRTALHYGTVGSGFYSDPFRDPGAFVRSAPYRIIALLADSWLTLGDETWRIGYAPWVLGAGVIAIAIALLGPLRRAADALEPAGGLAARALVWGSFLSLAPTLAVVPAFRLVGVSMIGVAGATALVLDHAWFSKEASREQHGSLVTLAAIFLAFTQLVHGPMTAFLASRIHRRDGNDFARRAAWTRDRLGDPLRADVGIVRGMAGTFFMPFALDPRGRTPAKWRLLAHGGHVLLLRPDDRTIELIVPEGRSLYPVGEQNLYRDPRSPLRKGDVVRAVGMTVTVLDVGPVGPRRARFVFDDVPKLTAWIADNFAGTEAIDLPAVGEGAPFDP